MAFSEAVKKQALERAGGKCENCGKPVTMATCEAHHKQPEASGGPDTLSNCRILCPQCHDKIH
ncbi:MAG: HNH endonuclease [Deltaproteobacteria bacterium]|nr:HNH endonuclease [Deltaproteobacteria bacterium]